MPVTHIPDLQKGGHLSVFTIDKYLTLGITAVSVVIGIFLKKHIRFPGTFCIPAPVIGGFLVSVLVFVLLWELAEFAVPIVLILIVQTIFMWLYAKYVVFTVMGSDHDAAVISADFINSIIITFCINFLC